MCLAPLTLPDGQQVACHECWQCLEHKVLDWQGRCIAEGATAAASFALTLTYGRNSMNETLHERAVVLTYSDFQKYLKLLRRHGYVVRYFVAGEYGSAKGRAHWHPILFFYPREDGKSAFPPICGPDHNGVWVEDALSRGEERVRFHHQRVDDKGKPVFLQNGKPALWWPHGFSYWTPVHENSVRYACSYVLKDMKDAEAQGHLSMSKKPPLGARYFERVAEKYVEAGLAPQSLEYRMDEARDSKGAPLQFMLKDRSAELFLEHYIRTWRERRPGRQFPASDLVSNVLEFGTYRVPEGPRQAIEWRERRGPIGPLDVPTKWKAKDFIGPIDLGKVKRRQVAAMRLETDELEQMRYRAQEAGWNGERQRQEDRDREQSVTDGIGFDPGLRDRWRERRATVDGRKQSRKRHDDFARRWRKA